MRDFFFDLLKKLELYQDEPIPNQTKNPASVQNFKKWPVFAAFSVKSSLRAQGDPIQKFLAPADWFVLARSGLLPCLPDSQLSQFNPSLAKPKGLWATC